MKRPNSLTDFEDTILHHIELIFYDDRTKSAKYETIISKWLSN